MKLPTCEPYRAKGIKNLRGAMRTSAAAACTALNATCLNIVNIGINI